MLTSTKKKLRKSYIPNDWNVWSDDESCDKIFPETGTMIAKSTTDIEKIGLQAVNQGYCYLWDNAYVNL